MTPKRNIPLSASLALLAFAALAGPARADNWTLTLATPDQVVAPGATAFYSGTISNGTGGPISLEGGLDFFTTPDLGQFAIDFSANLLALDLVIPASGYTGPIFEVTWGPDAIPGSFGGGEVLLQTGNPASPTVLTAHFTLATPGFGPFCNFSTGIGAAGGNAVASDDSSATPAIVYNNSGAGTLAYATFDGNGWTSTPIASGIGGQAAPSVAMDGDVRPHVVFYDAVAGDLVHAWDPGSGWQTEIVDGAGNVGAEPSLVIDAHGELHVSYYDVGQGDLRYARHSGGTWTSVPVDVTGDVGHHSAITADEFGHPFISYYDATAEDLKFARKSGGTWIPEVVDASGSRGDWTSIQVFANTQVSISYRDATSGSPALRYATGGPGSWTTEAVDANGDPGLGSALQLDSFGRPRIAYFDAGSGELRFAAKIGASWNVQPVASGATAQLSLSRNLNDEPILSYVDQTSGVLRFASITTCGVLSVGPPAATPRLTLSPNRPNPFSAHTTFSFAVQDEGEVTVRVYDAAGRMVAEPFRGVLSAGSHSIRWNGASRNGRRLAPGRYLLEVRSGRDTQTGGLVMLR